MEEKKENPFLNLMLSVIIPAFIMIKLSKPEYLGPVYGLIIALAFPISYGIYDFVNTKSVNFISILGFVSVLLTGLFGLIELDPKWIAVKEASVPMLIAIVIIISTFTPYPLIKKLLYNDKIIKTDLVDSALQERGRVEEFESSLKNASFWLAGSFVLSSVLNFALAKILLTSTPGTSEYTSEIGRMTALSFPVIALPCTILMVIVLWRLIGKIKTLTDLGFEEIFKAQ